MTSTQRNTILFLGLNVYEQRSNGQFVMPFYKLRFYRHYRMPPNRQYTSLSCCIIAVNTSLNYKYSEKPLYVHLSDFFLKNVFIMTFHVAVQLLNAIVS